MARVPSSARSARSARAAARPTAPVLRAMPARVLAAVALAAAALAGCAPGLRPVVAAPGGPGGEIPPPPPVAREFRGVWVATVTNIDWPSRPGLPVEQQRAELVTILDRARTLNLNAVVLQVRPAADALYASPFEPWSEYLTGRMGQAPDPAWDPLAFAVREAHARGLELHAWINPYRARHAAARTPAAPTHVSVAQPALVRQYGRSQWMDPGEPATQAWTLRVVGDVVRRYDVDGVHIDDYFYPYRERDATGAVRDFPDSASYARYRAGGGTLGRDDWRRENVDRFVAALYAQVKREKSWVKVGVSPFGIWRPGTPPRACCFDAYQEIYADARKWWRAGWVDYLTPQLYWTIAAPQQSYPMLLAWWAGENATGRHLWPGNYTSRVADRSRTPWSAVEIDSQIRLTRAQPGATGNVHFSMSAFLRDQGGVADTLARGVYAAPALVPASPWLPGRAPGAPTLALRAAGGVRDAVVDLAPAPGEARPWQWAVRARVGSRWRTTIVPGDTRTLAVRDGDRGADEVLVFGVDRTGREGATSRVAAPALAAR